MRGLKKCTRWRKTTHRQTDGHGDYYTNSAQRAVWVKKKLEEEEKLLAEQEEFNRVLDRDMYIGEEKEQDEFLPH
jgi:hypothetical protein